MKFNKEANKIFKITRNHLASIEDNIVNFKNFCKEIIDDNYPSPESQCYYQFYQDGNTMINIIHNSIKDMLFKFQQKYDDKERANVLFPYEKQAIYQYLNKFDFKKHSPKKCGCMYAEKIIKDGKEIVTIGLSICNDKDEFSKNIALNLAKKRAREYPTRYNIRVTPRPDKFPVSDTFHIPYKWMYEGELAKFVKRCTKWFKNETIIYPNNIDYVEFPKKKKNKSNKITDKKMPF